MLRFVLLFYFLTNVFSSQVKDNFVPSEIEITTGTFFYRGNRIAIRLATGDVLPVLGAERELRQGRGIRPLLEPAKAPL